MSTIVLALCLLMAEPHGVCARASPPTPVWATIEWVGYASHIVAGEAPSNCEVCNRWIACTIVRDIQRGYNPWNLYPGRWHGWKSYGPAHKLAVQQALNPAFCRGIPRCIYLGNEKDYRFSWSRYGPAIIVGNRNGTIVCVE